MNKIAVKDLIRKYLMKKYRKEIALGLGGSALVGGAIGYGLGKSQQKKYASESFIDELMKLSSFGIAKAPTPISTGGVRSGIKPGVAKKPSPQITPSA